MEARSKQLFSKAALLCRLFLLLTAALSLTGCIVPVGSTSF